MSIDLTVTAGICTIMINRPERINAMAGAAVSQRHVGLIPTAGNIDPCDRVHGRWSEKGSGSFLKKRTKKLLSVCSALSRERAEPMDRSFCCFFQKAVLACLATRTVNAIAARYHTNGPYC